MAGFIRYLFLANLFLIIMALFYHLVLSRETRFTANRYILLIGTGISLILPFFKLNWFPASSFSILTIPEIFVTAKSGFTHYDLDEIMIVGSAPFSIPWISIIAIAYITGTAIIGIMLIWKIKKLQYWTQQYPMKWFSNLYITLMPANWSPFSFMGIVYYPTPFDKEDRRSQMILEHERIHINQRHGWDIIFIEVVKVIFFYNPAIYTIKKQIQINHEFIADSSVVNEERKSYSQELLRCQLHVPQFQFIQQFNQTSFLKRRILMLMKNRSNSLGIAKYLLLLPVMAGLLWLSACTDEAEPTNPEQIDKSKSIIEMKSEQDSDLDTDKELNEEIFYIVEEMPEFDGEGLEKFRDWVQLNVKYPEIAIQNGISGTVYVDFVIDKTGNVTSIKIFRAVDPSLDNEVIRVLKSAPDWTPGKQRGKFVNVKMAIPVKFMLK